MMDQEKKIEEAVEQTLELFETPEKLPSSPFFYTKLQVRMGRLNRGVDQAYRSVFGVLRFASLMLLLVWNIVTVTYFFGSDQSDAYTRSQIISAFAEAYALELDD
tara:strand:+ start:76 stop:390 length:315 start_codon:yes stop_codon:yes gene_type:complete